MGLPALLLLAAPGLPVALVLLWGAGALRPLFRRLAPWAAAPALAAALLPGIEGVEVALSPLFTGTHLGVDALSRAFLLLTGGLWLAGGAYARAYHAEDPERDRFLGFFVLTLAGNVGLVASQDLLAFYLFFAVMTFGAYGLVVHRGDGEALRAGRIYIVMAVLGELCLLAGLFSLGWAGGGVTRFGPELGTAWDVLSHAGWGAGVAFLLVLGFGVKAGLAPLHLWLPLAHPVAPTAASALLSGAMIKAGLLGWIRYLPEGTALPGVGGALVIAGAASAFYGVVAGIAQDDPKTVLAYSSVSQMGYMAMGTGVLLLEPGLWPAALTAVVYYVLHHGIAKGALFLSVGVGERLAGRGRVRSLFLGATALPALALAGAPLTTGALAKGSLKEALGELGGAWYAVLDPLLLAAAGGTTLLLVRFLATLRSRVGNHGEAGVPRGMLLPWALLIGIGLAGPGILPRAFAPLEGVATPGLLEGLAAAALPVLLGAGVGWAVWRRPELLGSAARVRIPAGDLVVPIEAGVIRIGRPSQEGALRRAAEAAAGVRRLQLRGHGGAAWAAERDLYLMRGTVLALIVAGLGILFAVLLG